MTKYPPKDNIKVTSVTDEGFQIIIHSTEYDCPFDKFPWFRNGTVAQIKDVEGDADHLFWDELDIDLSCDSFKRLSTASRQVEKLE